MRLYVHGAGRTGADAWPFASRAGARFADLSTSASAVEQAAALSRMDVTAPLTVVAHSFGAIPVLFSISASTMHADHLVLLEPALYDLARGDEAVEYHIATMTRARERADNDDLVGYWEIVRPLMFGGPLDPGLWEAEEPLARRFSDNEPPWGHSVSAETIEPVPTLVLTGAWNAEYEAIASTLVRHGAIHRQLKGNKHRVQDHPDFELIVKEFIADY